MSKEPNRAAIGAFVIGAVALFIAGALFLGAGKFFTKKLTFITYFDGSVKGLSVGSPVMFRGVKIGSVTDISIIVDPSSRGMKVPVIFTLQPAKFKGSENVMQRDSKSIQKAITEHGLRTQLQSMSFLTGQLMVSLDFFPQKPARFVGLIKEYPEIPSVPTPLEELQKTVENLPIKEMVENLNSTLAGIDRLVQSIDAQKTMQSVEAALLDVRTLVHHVDARVAPLMENITKSAGSAEATLAETRETMAAARSSIKEFTASTKGTLESAQAALKQSEQTLHSYSGDSRLAVELNKTLREFSATARSLRQLADYLERHPESLLRGKTGSKGD